VTTQSSDGVGARRSKSRIVSVRVTEEDFAQLDALAHQTSCSRAQVLRRCLRGARLRSTVDAQALIEVSRIHADLNRIGGGMEQLPSLCLSRAATTQAEVSPPARRPSHPSRVRPRPKTTSATARSPANHRDSESSQSNGRRFKRPGIPAPGFISSRAAPRAETPVRFDC
jgi:hypothetical protein